MPQLEVIENNRFRDETAERNFAPPFTPAPVRVPAPAPRRSPPPAAKPMPKPSAITRLAQGAARLANRLLVFLTPMPSGPEGTGNLFGGPGALYPPGTTPPPLQLPEPLLELEPVYITPPPRKPPRIDAAPDDISPPNWWEIATDRPGETFRDWNEIIERITRIGRRAYDTLDFLRGLDDRQASQPSGGAGVLPFPSGPLVFPEFEPGPLTSPATRPAPARVLPDPFRLPDPVRIGSPGFDPLPSTRTRPGTRPGTGPATRAPANPAGPLNPLSPFFQLPENYRPARPGTRLPDFIGSPSTSLLDDPIGERFPDPLPEPGDDPEQDACQCDKEPKKKKPKRKPREVCKQGTYTQRAKGIKYAPKRTVPCEGEIEPERKSSKPKAKRRTYPTSLPDLINNWS